MAVTIKIKKTGQLQQVTRNIAFDLIERGIAERVYEKEAIKVKEEPTGYATEHQSVYKNRQMHSMKK